MASGAGGSPAPTEGCQPNQICATLTVGTEFPSELKQVVVVLYEDAPVITENGPPWPFATYEPLLDVELSASKSFLLQQDFTKPAWGGEPSGERYIAVVAFFSNEARQGVPGVDFWSVSSEPVAIALGEVIELGEIRLTRIPVVDDPDTAGNDTAGVVTCIARLHDEVDPHDYACDVSKTTCCIFQVDGGACSASGCADDGSEFEHACDGPEDCASGEVCCGAPMQSHRCTAADSCAAKRVCHISAHCSGAASVCVIASSGIADVGYCVGPDPLTPGDDRPSMVQCYPSTDVCNTRCCFDEVSGATECRNSGCSGTMSNSLNCDGPEDCLSGERCCVSSTGDRLCSSPSCANVVCHVDGDCREGQCGANGQCSL